jgi:preprotein translocase subunit Sec63
VSDRQRSPERVLGLRRGASAEEIRTAYRVLARKYHPDISKLPDAEEKFKALGTAYAALQRRTNFQGILPDFDPDDFDFIPTGRSEVVARVGKWELRETTFNLRKKPRKLRG